MLSCNATAMNNGSSGSTIISKSKNTEYSTNVEYAEIDDLQISACKRME